MAIIIAHEETCDIVANGPTREIVIQLGEWRAGPIPTKRQIVNTVCTCGGVQYRVSSSTEGGAHLYRIKPAEASE